MPIGNHQGIAVSLMFIVQDGQASSVLVAHQIKSEAREKKI
jgi:hypothetical protein